MTILYQLNLIQNSSFKTYMFQDSDTVWATCQHLLSMWVSQQHQQLLIPDHSPNFHRLLGELQIPVSTTFIITQNSNHDPIIFVNFNIRLIILNLNLQDRDQVWAHCHHLVCVRVSHQQLLVTEHSPTFHRLAGELTIPVRTTFHHHTQNSNHNHILYLLNLKLDVSFKYIFLQGGDPVWAPSP